MGVVLPGEADAAEHLDRRPGRSSTAASSADRAGDRGGDRELLGVVVVRRGGVPGDRGRGLGRLEHLGAQVLDRLEGADRCGRTARGPWRTPRRCRSAPAGDAGRLGGGQRDGDLSRPRSASSVDRCPRPRRRRAVTVPTRVDRSTGSATLARDASSVGEEQPRRRRSSAAGRGWSCRAPQTRRALARRPRAVEGDRRGARAQGRRSTAPEAIARAGRRAPVAAERRRAATAVGSRGPGTIAPRHRPRRRPRGRASVPPAPPSSSATAIPATPRSVSPVHTGSNALGPRLSESLVIAAVPGRGRPVGQRRGQGPLVLGQRRSPWCSSSREN